MYKGLGTALIGTIVVLTMFGTTLGAALGNTDLFNPPTSAAEARRMDVQTQLDATHDLLDIGERQTRLAAQRTADALDLQHQAVMNEQAEQRSEAELEHYKTTLEMEQTSLQRQHELELQYKQRALERELAAMEVQRAVFLGTGLGAILAITIAAVYYLYVCAQSKLARVPRLAESHQTAAYRGGAYAQPPIHGGPTGPTAPSDMWATPSGQHHQGGNGRGPRRPQAETRLTGTRLVE
jgi:hypothetical protein